MSPYEQAALDIYLVPESPDVTEADLGLMAEGYLLQLVQDVAPRYPTLGLERSTMTVCKLADVPAAPTVDLTDPTKRAQILLAFLPDSDVARAAGYHTTTPDGRPYGRVFTRDQGVVLPLKSIQVTGSHETIEAACDLAVNCSVIGPDGKARDREPGDPVEVQSYTKHLPNGDVELSDFVFATWFDGSGPPPYNFTGNVTSPCVLGPPVDGQQENYIQGENPDGSTFTDPPEMAMRLLTDPKKNHPASRTAKREAAREAKRNAATDPPPTHPTGT